MKKTYVGAYLLFGMVAFVDIWLASSSSPVRFYTKPLLMPLLMLGYFLHVRPLNQFSRTILLALFFSWMGDVFLMFEASNPIFFIAGLVSFLTAHLLYILYFARIPENQSSFLRKRPIMLLAVVAYVMELMYVLWPHLGGMKIPVVVYGLVIGAMLCFALWQYGKISSRAAILFIIGAICFITSDSLLAINKFKSTIPSGGIWIMSTYILAQCLIALGSAEHLQTRPKSLDN